VSPKLKEVNVSSLESDKISKCGTTELIKVNNETSANLCPGHTRFPSPKGMIRFCNSFNSKVPLLELVGDVRNLSGRK